MRKAIGLFLLVLAIRPTIAQKNWPLTIKVLNTENLADEHGTFRLSWGGGSGGAGWAHRVHEHVFVVASDGNSYELQPKNEKDMLLPGTFQAEIERRDMKVCEPKGNGNCRGVKFFIVQAKSTPTVPKANPQTPPATPK